MTTILRGTEQASLTVATKPQAASDGKAGDLAARVLIVEDEAMIATYIADVLAESGFTVSGVASTGAEALSIAGESGADLALVDIKLSGPMDGIEVAQQMREQFGIGAIFLSGTNDPAVVARAAVAQPYGFLQKPFLPSQVYKALERALRQHRDARRA